MHEFKVDDRVVGGDNVDPYQFRGITGTVKSNLGDDGLYEVDFDCEGGVAWCLLPREIYPLRECEIGVIDGVRIIEGSKPSNPKDLIGSRKVPSSVVPQNVLALVACGLSEGMGKYGRHNYRGAGVRASVYFDANQRHMSDWWEGENIDPDSQQHHVIKAICSNIVLADSILRGNLTDDRPPPSPKGWMAEANVHAARMADKAAAFAEKNGAPHHWTINDEIPS